MKSRRSLKREEKYYLADLGFYFAINTDTRINYGPALENITYLYARAQNCDISVGKIGTLECDFIVRGNSEDYAYLQVAMTIAERKTEEREYAPFEKIADSYPKYLLTMDHLLQRRSGVHHVNIANFIAEEKSF